MIPDLTDYNNKKTKGLIFIQKIDGENFAVCEKKYDLAKAALGELVEMPAEVRGVTMTEVETEIVKVNEEGKTRFNELNAFKKDLIEAV